MMNLTMKQETFMEMGNKTVKGNYFYVNNKKIFYYEILDLLFKINDNDLNIKYLHFDNANIIIEDKPNWTKSELLAYIGIEINQCVPNFRRAIRFSVKKVKNVKKGRVWFEDNSNISIREYLQILPYKINDIRNMVGYSIKDISFKGVSGRTKFSSKQLSIETILELEKESNEFKMNYLWYFEREGAEIPIKIFKLLQKYTSNDYVWFDIYGEPDEVKREMMYAYIDMGMHDKVTEIRFKDYTENYVLEKLKKGLRGVYLDNISEPQKYFETFEGKHTVAGIYKSIQKGYNSDFTRRLISGGFMRLVEDESFFQKIQGIKIPEDQEIAGHIYGYIMSQYAGLKVGNTYELSMFNPSIEEIEKIKKWSKKSKKVYYAPLEHGERLTMKTIKKLLQFGVIKDDNKVRSTLEFWNKIMQHTPLLDSLDETIVAFIQNDEMGYESIELFAKYRTRICNIQQIESIGYRTLNHEDPIALNIGLQTNCCQYIGGIGEECAIDSVRNPNADLLVWEDETGIIAQSWIWSPEPDKLIMDNIEFRNDYVHPEKVKETMKEILKKFSQYAFIGMGTGYNELSFGLERQHNPYNPGIYNDSREVEVLKDNGKIMI